MVDRHILLRNRVGNYLFKHFDCIKSTIKEMRFTEIDLNGKYKTHTVRRHLINCSINTNMPMAEGQEFDGISLVPPFAIQCQ